MRLIGLFILILSFISCNNELNVIEEFKDIPVVYGVISATESVQYIRLERGFIDANTSALELAKDPNQLYYPDAQVSLVLKETGEEFPLEMIDGEDEGYPREDGVFAQSPNYLYKINSADMTIIEGQDYELKIDRGGDDLPIVTASTKMVAKSRLISPNPSTTSAIDFNYVQFNTFSWLGGDGAATYDFYIRFNYRERVGSNGPFDDKSVTWLVIKNTELDEYETAGRNFYSFLSGAIPQDQNYERRFSDIDVVLESGGQEILELNRINSANLGITSSQDVPSYSNLSEGRGIFSSKYKDEITGISLSPRSLDSLANGIITGELGFRN